MTQLVFLHGPGAGACADAYTYQSRHFPGSVAPTLPGHLEGSRCLDVAGYTEWVRGWLWAQGLNKDLVLVGYTLGASIALQYGLDYPDEVSGLVIMIPALNLPAFQAGKRTSPIDGGNMNRAFPGRADGTITEMIAHYLTTRILPLCDGVVDVHAGGRSLGFLPSAIIHDLPDRGLMARTLAAMKAFAAPYGLVLKELDPVGMMDHVVENAGRVFVSTELGGGATSTAETIAIAERGLSNILKNFGILPSAPEVQTPGRILHTPDGDCFVSAPANGLYEIVADLGPEVAAGQTLARIHHLEEPHRDPDILISARPGLVICRHVPGLIRRGDCAAVIAEDWSAAS